MPTHYAIAMVAATMRTRFDQFGKQLVRDAVDGLATVETDAEVAADTRRIDLWITPLKADTPPLEHLGLLGHIIWGAVTLEFFHKTPSGDELCVCLIKHGELLRSLSRKKTLPPLPLQWVISSGRPDAGIEGLAFSPMTTGLPGCYESPRLHYTRLVVASELPAIRETLLVRLLGAGAVLTRAIAELHALPADAPERVLALPVLLRLRLAVPTDPAHQTADDQEFLMNTHDIVETWRREAIQEGVQQGLEQGVQQGLEQGVQQGLEQGERRLLLRQIRRRFGADVDDRIERRIAAARAEQIELWAERVLSASTLAEILAD